MCVFCFRVIMLTCWIAVFSWLTNEYIDPLTVGTSLPITVAGALLWGAIFCATCVFVFNLWPWCKDHE